MKFGHVLKRQIVPEWSEFYLNYALLKKLISPAKLTDKLFVKATFEGGEGEVSNIGPEEIASLQRYNKKFEEVVMLELYKISGFYRSKIKDILRKWRSIKLNALLVKRSKQKPNYDELKSMLKNCFQVYYKELRLVGEFITLNLEAFRKIFKKFKKHSKLFDPKNNLKSIFEEKLRDIHIHYHKECIQNLISHVESDYLEIFYNRGDERKQGQEELRKIYQGKEVTEQETFFFGFYLGLCVSIIMLMITIYLVTGLQMEEDPIFPIFRGIGILILYLWLLAWNVSGWINNNINYRLIFGFSYHYSTLSEILRRAASFTAVFMLIVLWYILSLEDLGKLSNIINVIPRENLPLIVWISFLGYMFFPSKEHFNYQGRAYTYRLLIDMVTSPFHSNTFRVFWATDQLQSFVVLLMDFEYVLCYYIGDGDKCDSADSFDAAVLIAFVPLLLRMIQKKDSATRYLLNAIKYLISVVIVVASYAYGLNHSAKAWWLWAGISFIGTLFSYYWDLRIDWGFLVPGSKHKFLRNDLSYSDVKIYYYAMISNFVFRIFWVLSISPAIVRHFPYNHVFTAVVGIIEIFRRSIWNFLRVEKEHIANCGSFKAVSDYKLPYDQIEINIDESQKYLFQGELLQLMESQEEEEMFDLPSLKERDDSMRVSVPKEGDIEDSVFAVHPTKYIKTKGMPQKTQSLLNITVADINTLKLDPKEIDLIMKDIKEYKEALKKRAEFFQVIVKHERRHSEIVSHALRMPLIPRIESSELLSKLTTRMNSRPK